MKALILLILRLFSPSWAAALEAKWAKDQEIIDAQIQENQRHEAEIDAATEAAKTEVDSLSGADLDDRIDGLLK